MTPSLRLSPEAGCLLRLRWRVELEGAGWLSVVEALKDCGWSQRESRIPNLLNFAFAGHEWLLIEQTGRMELRLDLLSPLDERRERALGLVTALARRLDALVISETEREPMLCGPDRSTSRRHRPLIELEA